MHVRYDAATRRVRHLSVPPFTEAPGVGEADCEMAEAPYPGPITQLRLTATLSALEVDPALVPVPPTKAETFAAQFDAMRLLRACMGATLREINALRTDPTTAKPELSAAEWRQKILDVYLVLI